MSFRNVALLTVVLMTSCFVLATTAQVSSISPVSGPAGTQVQINGSGFGATQLSSTVNLGGPSASVVSWSDTQITVVVPQTATTGYVRVTVGGVGSNTSVYFNVPAPQVTSVSPASGVVGTQITVTGSGFHATQSTSTIIVGGFYASVVSWTDTQIVATVAANSTSGAVSVSVNGVTSNKDVTFTMPSPVVWGLVPQSGPVGTSVQINGSGFGATQGTSILQFNGVTVTPSAWSDTSITATIPATVYSGPVKVTVGGVASPTNVSFTVPPPVITSTSPSTGVAGTQVTITGSGFQATKGAGSSLSFTSGGSTVTATTTTWTDTQIVATVPGSVTTGPVKVTVNYYVGSNQDISFKLISPVVTSISPTSGPVNTQVQVNGTGFGATQGTSSLKINGWVASVISWSDTQIAATVPATANTGPVQITIGNVTSPANVYFTLPTPQVNSITPSSGAVGTQVTVNGSGFRPTQSAGGNINLLAINGSNATIVSWSDTQIVATVPAGATTGPVTVYGFGASSNVDVVFTMANPIINSLAPVSGPVGTQVQINGSGFGATQGSSSVTFNSTAVTIVSWSDTQIVVTVPTTATTGPVKVTEGGVASNSNLNFTVPAPQITSISPTSGVVGTQVTVTGSGFQANKGSSTLTFSNGTAVTIASWSDTQIVATVPANATAGPVKVTVNNISSNQDLVFTMPNPSIVGINPTGGPVGTQVQISGSGFGASQGSSAVTINVTNATIVSWSNTLITANVASGTTSGVVKVTVGGVASNNPSFTVTNLFVNAVSPKAGPVNTPVTVSGKGFGASQGSSTITFNNVNATSISSWTDSQIVANVPSTATSGAVKVTVGGVSSNTTTTFTVGGVAVNSLNPVSGSLGSQVQINGSGFGATQGSSTVTFFGISAAVTAWSNTQITATVPVTTATGPVVVTVGGVASDALTFTVITPLVTSISPSSGTVGTQIQINGVGFGPSIGSSWVNFSGGNVTSVVNWSDSLITLNVPSTARTGAVYVTVGNTNSNLNIYFTIPDPKITSISPTSGVVGTQVTVNGSGFRSSPGSLYFNGVTTGITSWSDTQIVAVVPANARTGPVRVNRGVDSNQDVVFTTPNPVVASVTPASGGATSQFQITGSGFGATQGSSTVTVNSAVAPIVSWTDTVITVTVPTTARSGQVVVTVGGVSSLATIDFNIPLPVVTSVTPNRTVAGTQITITGTGFRATQGAGQVLCGNIYALAQIVSWSDTQIVATVPVNAVTGPLNVYINAYSNSDVLFTLINPVVASLVPTSGRVGTQVQVNGTGFGATQGTSSISFNGFTAQVVSWSDTQIVATVPAASRSGAVQVTVSGVGSNPNVVFNVPLPRITGVSPASGAVGASVTITGTGFQAAAGTNGIVHFANNVPAPVTSWSDTQIVVTVPPGSTTGGINVVASNGDYSNQDVVFTLPNATVTGLVPSAGPTGIQVQVNGKGFGATQGSSSVTFNAAPATVVSWSDTQIVAVVPAAAVSGPVQVTEGGVPGNSSVNFTVPAPSVASIAPAIGGVGNTVTIAGTGFQATQRQFSYATIGGQTATIKSWSDTQIVAVVPGNAVTGSASVTVNSVGSNYVSYIVPNNVITTVTPSTGPVGTQVTVAGAGFGASQGTSVLTFNGQLPASIASWSDAQIVATVPVTAAAGPVVVNVAGNNSNANVIFNVPGPNVGLYTPRGGTPGTSFTVNGSGFQASQRNSTLTINGTPATITSWSDTQIVATVPTGATTGPLLVNVNGVSSYASNSFEVPFPTITSVTPPEAPAGGTVTIIGTGFGASNWVSPDGISMLYVGFVNINGIQAGVISWSDTSIVTQVPPNATTGPVTVLKFNAVSNGMPIAIEGVPTVTGLSPSEGPVSASVVISGSGFGSTQANSTVTFSGTTAVVTAWGDTQITALVPSGAYTGPVNVTVAGVTGPSSDFTLNQTVQVTDSLGHISSYTLSQLGGAWHPRFTSATGCSSCNLIGFLNMTVSSKGNLTTQTDELGRPVTYTYDDDNNVTSESRQLDANTPVTTSYTYNSFGEPLTVTDPLGNVSTNSYDANGNLLTVTSPAPDASTAASVTHFTYDLKGQMTQITDPLGRSTTLAYNAVGLISSITDAQGNVTAYAYDLRGNRTSVTDALNNQTTFTYDAGNRLTRITYPDTTFVSFVYDSRGRRTSVTDQNGRVTSYTYDDADRLTAVTDAAQNVTHYAYDTENDLLSITDAAGHTTSFTYDALRRVSQTSFPSGLAEGYVYDAVGNLASKIDRKGQIIQYVYDGLDRLTHKGYPDATGVDYVYDLAGKIRQVTDSTGTYGFAYDNMGRLLGTTTQYSFLPGHTYTNSYTYDAASNRAGFTAPDGSTNAYVYDTLNRLSTLTDSGAGQFTYSYDVLSRRTGLTRPNGVNTTYGLDSQSRLLNVLHKAGTTTLDGAGYTYDNAGNRTSKTNYLNNTTEQYTYDPLYQLTQVTQGATTTESYSYDPVGNRLSSLGMSPSAYNSSNQLTSNPAATFTYDGNGNTLTKVDANGTTTYTWDFENRLTSVVLPGSGGTVTFKYDPSGRRIQKSSWSGTTNYLYDGANSVAELDQAGNLQARYVQGVGIDEPLAELRGGTTAFYEADGLGSVTSLSNSASSLVNTYFYDAFGNVAASTGAFANPFQYTARETDSETGLRYYRARYYDPSTGRFLSEDPVTFEGGMNFYAYVLNNPTDLIDPSGLSPRPVQPYRWRDCDPPEKSYCVTLCAFQGKTFESCSVGQRKRIVRLKRGPEWVDHIGPPSCSCKEKEPACEKSPQPQPVPFIIPIIDPLADYLHDWFKDRWDELKRWHPPQPSRNIWDPPPMFAPPPPIWTPPPIPWWAR